MVRIAVLVLCAILSVSVENVSAQVHKEHADSVVAGRDRWALRTNALEWLLTIPNVGFEYDLSKSIYNRFSFNINARYNWNTAHNYAPPLVFNLLELRPEFRYYWRQSQGAGLLKNKKDSENPKKKNAKTWRAYYLGWYLNGGTYGFKFGKEGRQGQMIGTGFSFGYGIPLYEYKKCAVDVELGFALGVAMTRYTAFAHNPDGNYYYRTPELDRDKLFFVPYPVVSELKVAFVLRRTSIDKKYKSVNTEKITQRMNKKDEKAIAKAEAKAAREAKRNDSEKVSENDIEQQTVAPVDDGSTVSKGDKPDKAKGKDRTEKVKEKKQKKDKESKE